MVEHVRMTANLKQLLEQVQWQHDIDLHLHETKATFKSLFMTPNMLLVS